MNNVIALGKYDERPVHEVKCTAEEGRTKQSFTDLCDINKIIERFARTGQLPEQPQKQYGDFSNVSDYQTSIMIVQKAHDQFMSLDAKVRARFNNDPQAFLEFTADSSNIAEMIKLGLAKEVLPEAVKSDSEPNAASPEVAK